MRHEAFQGGRVIETGSGQCPECRLGVIRVLVQYQIGRQWFAADVGNYGYVPHVCPSDNRPSDNATLQRAA